MSKSKKEDYFTDEFSDKEYLNDSDFDSDFDLNADEIARTLNPNINDSETFKLRNDPKTLLDQYKLQLLNAYIKTEKIKDSRTGEERTISRVKRIKGTEPKANKQGISDIISYLQKFINNHTVQGNLHNMEEYRVRMIYISNDLTIHFMAHRSVWGISLNEIDSIVSNCINLIDLFLTRTLFNKEREGYSEGYKEVTNKQINPTPEKRNIFQKLGGLVGGGNMKNGY